MEIMIFTVAVVLSASDRPSWEAFGNALILTFVAAATYGLALLYLPLSLLGWLGVRRLAPKAEGVADSSLFLVHGWIAMSIMHNGPWLLARPLPLENPLIVAWLAVSCLHLGLLAARSLRARASVRSADHL